MDNLWIIYGLFMVNLCMIYISRWFKYPPVSSNMACWKIDHLSVLFLARNLRSFRGFSSHLSWQRANPPISRISQPHGSTAAQLPWVLQQSLSHFHILQLPRVSQGQRPKAELRRAGAGDAQDLPGAGEMRQDLAGGKVMSPRGCPRNPEHSGLKGIDWSFIFWLVVWFLPLCKRLEFVNWYDDIPNWLESHKSQVPVTTNQDWFAI